MTLTVSAWLENEARPVMAAQAGRAALSFLAELADFQKLMALDQARLPRTRSLPPVVEIAIRAVRLVDPSLTPMAAVAGAVAQEVCGVAAGLGADRVIVNNGGDIALHLGPGQEAVVGLKPPGREELCARLILDSGSGVGGVASSGWAGRSHSPGVADLVSVWAASAALADAAATLIAGACQTRGGGVETRPAAQVDPGSDLGQGMVTVRVGRLSRKQKEEAEAQGLEAAQRLQESGIIRGCFIDVQGVGAGIDPDGFLQPGKAAVLGRS